MSPRSQDRRASRQAKARRRWLQNERAQAPGATGNLGREVTDRELKDVCRRDRPLPGPTA